MAASDPLRTLQEQAQAQFMAFGLAAATAPGGDDRTGAGADGNANAEAGAVELVATFGEYEAEYAAIRRGVGILTLPQRGLLQLTGADRHDFLHRMLTQDVHGLTGGQSRRAFQLNHQGRITADLVVHYGDAGSWLEGDACDLPALAALYESRLFGEDVTIQNISDERTALALHGPATGDLLSAVCSDDPAPMLDLPGTHHVLRCAGELATAYRWDDCGGTGVRLWPRRDHAAALYARLAQAVGGLVPDVDAEAPGGGAKRPIKGRGIGWLAFNTARIEAGSPLFHVDFGPDSLPHETGLIADAVSFTKGCYLGQEIVARMQNLGHPRRTLAGLKCDDDRQPVTGAQVFDPADASSAIGAVTSSTLSPLLGGAAVALAMMKWGRHTPGTSVTVAAEGALAPATVHALRFMP